LTNRLVYVSGTIYNESTNRHLSPKNLSTIIPNGIDCSEFAPTNNSMNIRAQLATDPKATVICFAGRLSEEKGIDILLDSVAKLNKTYPLEKIRLWIIGDGPLKTELMERTNFLGLEKFVRFTGFQTSISDYLHESDIFVLPSRHEAMSIVLLEALACGLPCIVTDVGENAEVIENGVQGLVIPPDQTRDLTKALDILLNNPSLRETMRANAFERAKNYSDHKMIETLQQLYKEILGE